MEQLSGFEIIVLTIITGLFISFMMYFQSKEKAILHGFNEDFREFMMDINSTNDLRILAALESAIRIFRNEYKKHIQKDVVDDACGRLQAAIQNRRQVINNSIKFLTGA